MYAISESTPKFTIQLRDLPCEWEQALIYLRGADSEAYQIPTDLSDLIQTNIPVCHKLFETQTS